MPTSIPARGHTLHLGGVCVNRIGTDCWSCHNIAKGGNQTTPLPISPDKGLYQVLEEAIMDKDRVVGSAKEVKGNVKQAVGKAAGDAKLEAEGKSDKVEGKVQNAVGGVKDAVREAVKK